MKTLHPDREAGPVLQQTLGKVAVGQEGGRNSLGLKPLTHPRSTVSWSSPNNSFDNRRRVSHTQLIACQNILSMDIMNVTHTHKEKCFV